MDTTEQTPAQSVRFADLGLSKIALAAVDDLGYEAPTPVQERAIPSVLEGRDVLAAAQTGTGKTAAFLLPVMDRLGHIDPVSVRGRAEGQGPFMLVITPTRELAQQIEDVCRTIAKRTHHTCLTVVGGVGYNPQKDALKRGCDILIATPGRLLDLIDQEACSLSQVSVLVLDEADRMLDMGFAPDVRKIVGFVPADRQTLLFSATLDEAAVGAIVDLVRDPVRIEVAPITRPTEAVAQYVLPVALDAKNGLLTEVLKRQGARRVIVFCRTKRRADTCAKRLARAGFTCQVIHGDRSQAQRERALAAFRAGECDVLVATDVLSRGIDISDVSYVVNFDVPSDPVDYIHRIGRTGRAGELGWSLTFVTPEDLDEFFDIEALMGKTVEVFDARGLEVGEGAPVLDPARVPASHVPGKKAKKRRRARARAGETGVKNAAKVQAARVRRAEAPKAQAPDPAGGGELLSEREVRQMTAGKGGSGAKVNRGASGTASSADRERGGAGGGHGKEQGGKKQGGKGRGGRAAADGAKRRGGKSDGHAQQRAGKGGSKQGARAASKGGSPTGAGSASRKQRDAWRNYDEPDGRYGRGSVSRAGSGTVKNRSSKSTRRPGDGGGASRG